MIRRNIKTKIVNRHFDKYDIYIGSGTKWANPFIFEKDANKEESIRLYESYVRNNHELMESLKELEGKILGCSCKPDICHGDVLIKLIKEME